MLAFSFYLNFEGEFQMLVYESTKLNNNFNIFICFVDFFRRDDACIVSNWFSTWLHLLYKQLYGIQNHLYLYKYYFISKNMK